MPHAAPDRFLSARQVCERYGVTAMTLWRWLRDSEMEFPQPIYINGRRFWNERDLIAWERRQR
jgi:predicted DNA-binding transcriptional regulator AlpA